MRSSTMKQEIIGFITILCVFFHIVLMRKALSYFDVTRKTENKEISGDFHLISAQAPSQKIQTQEEFTFRNASKYSIEKMGYLYKTRSSGLVKHYLNESKCLDFTCTHTRKDPEECGVTITHGEYNNNVYDFPSTSLLWKPTSYDGDKPPCCSHIIRDMAKMFDATMQDLRLDYSVGFGSLLGLVREDSFIPWTADNDYIIPSSEVMNAVVSLWDEKQTGMQHLFQNGVNRLCITSDWADGKLKNKWGKKRGGDDSNSNNRGIWMSGHPYIDLYVGRMISQNIFQERKPCRHLYEDLFPTKRVLIYNGLFSQRIPANPEQFLRTYYGKDWRVPQQEKKPHGGATLCPYNETY